MTFNDLEDIVILHRLIGVARMNLARERIIRNSELGATAARTPRMRTLECNREIPRIAPTINLSTA